MAAENSLSLLIKKNETILLDAWLKEQLGAVSRQGVIQPDELRAQCAEFLRLYRELDASESGESPAKRAILELLNSISRSRGLQGFSPSETAKFVFSLKKPVFDMLQAELGMDPDSLARNVMVISQQLDQLGLYTMEVYQKSREEVILRQGQELLELSTPVVKLWDGVLALPLIGTLDSARTQVVMESLLQKIVETGADVAIIDITGVPTVDTLVAQHLLKTVTAARLMGADCIISGIRPQIAQTIVHLGVNLGDIVTKASLGEAFKTAIQKAGLAVVKAKTNL